MKHGGSSENQRGILAVTTPAALWTFDLYDIEGNQVLDNWHEYDVIWVVKAGGLTASVQVYAGFCVDATPGTSGYIAIGLAGTAGNPTCDVYNYRAAHNRGVSSATASLDRAELVIGANSSTSNYEGYEAVGVRGRASATSSIIAGANLAADFNSAPGTNIAKGFVGVTTSAAVGDSSPTIELEYLFVPHTKRRQHLGFTL